MAKRRDNNFFVPPPRAQPLFPDGWVHFKRWRTLRWFCLLLLPLGPSVAAAWGRAGVKTAVILGLLGVAVAAALFVTLASGVTSSNWGTFDRGREPRRYWEGACLLMLFYAGLCAAGWAS